MPNPISLHAVALGAALVLGAATSALAAPLTLSYAQTGAGITGAGAVTDATLADSYFYGNSYGNLTGTVYTPASGPSAGINFEFYDAYVFTISGATVNSVSSTITLSNIFSIDNLQARLYNAAGQVALPVLGSPVGGAIEAWSQQVGPGGNVTVAVIDEVLLSAGTYVLELRGSVSGLAGGSYSGVLNVAPVPAPAAAWLFGSALMGMTGLRRRKPA
jgi:hypothetical protein